MMKFMPKVSAMYFNSSSFVLMISYCSYLTPTSYTICRCAFIWSSNEILDLSVIYITNEFWGWVIFSHYLNSSKISDLPPWSNKSMRFMEAWFFTVSLSLSYRILRLWSCISSEFNASKPFEISVLMLDFILFITSRDGRYSWAFLLT